MTRQKRQGEEEHAYPHWSTDTVRWSDTDQLGHVNHLAIGAYFETGRSRFVSEIEERGQIFVTASLTIDFLRELHWPDPVTVGTAVLDVGKTSCKLIQGLFSDGICVAVAAVILVLIDGESRNPVEIPHPQRARMTERRLR
ncbi:acyl-CoA thioesterase [Paraburkholderia sp. MM5482-R1]|uniref:acyl-CoA thioesterase n=1 Tax=unclassified Paraburkholderia TaxID=2615204 RepID=UPI003D225320